MILDCNTITAMMASFGTGHHLLTIPDELLISIISNLDLDALLQTVLVCKHLSDLAEPFLYHHITILNGRQGAALSHSLLARPCRTTWVRTFLISTKLGEEEGLSRLPPFIARMTNLQDLRLETPDCNKVEPSDRVGWISLQGRYERVFEGASILFPNKALRHLPGLQSCKWGPINPVSPTDISIKVPYISSMRARRSTP